MRYRHSLTPLSLLVFMVLLVAAPVAAALALLTSYAPEAGAVAICVALALAAFLPQPR